MTKAQQKKEDARVKRRDERHAAVALAVRKKFAKEICKQADIIKIAMKDLMHLRRSLRYEDPSLKYARDDILDATFSYGEDEVLHEAMESIRELFAKSADEAGVKYCCSSEDERSEDDEGDSDI
jgi:hypothetical protein